MNMFLSWHHHAVEAGTVTHRNAMCLSTIDAEGMPHARTVDLKAVSPAGFVFCTSYSSPKAGHIDARPNVSLTFWWDHVGRQVRVLGAAARISPGEADKYFAERSRDAQLASWAFVQSEPFESGHPLANSVAAARARFAGATVPRPASWGGYLVSPRRMEFLAFSSDRVHQRILYVRHDSRWSRSELQP